MKTFILQLILVSLIGLFSLHSNAAVIYVDITATGNDNGNNWNNAYTDLQDALAEATSGDDIWVANGTYKPTNTTDREIFFTIPAGVRLYGGFSGNETSKSQRDWNLNLTKISGNIGNNTLWTDNSKILINIIGGSDAILVDGFIIQGAYNETGANFPILSADDVEFKHCIFNENYSDGPFQFYVVSSNVFFQETLFQYNISTGNMMECSSGANVTLTNSTWVFNTALIIMHSNTDFGLNAYNCIGWDNVETNFNNFENASNCLFENSIGGILNPVNITSEDPLFTDEANGDFTLSENSPAIGEGDNSFTSQGLDLAHNFRISGVNVDLGCYERRVPTVQYVDGDASGLNNGADWANAFNLIEDALLVALPGDKIWVAEGLYYALDPNNTDQQFVIPDGVDLKGGFSGTETQGNQASPGDHPTILSANISALPDYDENSLRILYLLNTEIGVTVEGFILEGIDGAESAIHLRTESSEVVSNANVKNCIFRLNATSFASNSIRTDTNNSTAGETDLTLENCLFYINLEGAVVSAGLGINTMKIVGCTFANNQTSNPVTNMVFSGPSSDVSIYNTIFWDNTNNSYQLNGISDVQNIINQFGSTSGTLLNSDPLFNNPSGFDYTLSANSPAVGFGNNDYVNTNKDFLGEDRIQGLYVDLGCFESPFLVGGCTSISACNYDSLAEVDNGSCTFPGCTDPEANNYSPSAGCDNGNCDYSPLITYVSQDADGENDGSSWFDAFNTIQEAINATDAGDQVWVAYGTYQPYAFDRNIPITLKDGVELYGGFYGDETSLDQRNWAENETIISGEIGLESFANDNSLTLLYADSHENPVIIDGFILRDQYMGIDQADDVENAPLYVINCDLNIRNCIFSNNYAYQACAINSNGPYPKDVIISNCLFADNYCNFGSIIKSDNDLDINMYHTTIANTNYLGTPNGKLFNLYSPSELNMYNSIIYNSGVTDLISDQPDLHLENVILDVDYGESGSFINVTIGDPNFVQPSSGNYTLTSSSVAINYGDNSLVESDLDLDHKERILGASTDAGCYEFEESNAICMGDANGDGLVNAVDYLAISSFFGCTSGCTTGDANGDGLVNAVDYLAVSSFFGVPCD